MSDIKTGFIPLPRSDYCQHGPTCSCPCYVQPPPLLPIQDKRSMLDTNLRKNGQCALNGLLSFRCNKSIHCHPLIINNPGYIHAHSNFLVKISQ